MRGSLRGHLVSMLVCGFLAVSIKAHGYLADPPARPSAWRMGFPTPVNYDDNGFNCGGRAVQHEQNGGKCGVCGDNYASLEKINEPGPGNTYATGEIVGQYAQGQAIAVTVTITAFHQGYIEFKLCENNVTQNGYDASIAVDQSCFDQHLLTTPTGLTRIPAELGTFTHELQLPGDVTCTACVIQWRYRAGNSWGCEMVDGVQKCGLGFGPQEEFQGCSDVAIVSSSTTDTTTSTASTTTTKSASSTAMTTTTTTASTTSTSTEPSPTGLVCYGILDSMLNGWCSDNCRLGNCPPSMCWCQGQPLPTIQYCEGVYPYGSSLNYWCMVNCNHEPPFCPATHCSCQEALFVPPS